MADPVEVLDYWVGELGEEGWFDGGAEVDDEIAELFLSEQGVSHTLINSHTHKFKSSHLLTATHCHSLPLSL